MQKSKITRGVFVKFFFIFSFTALLFFIWFSNWLMTRYIFAPGTDPAAHLQFVQDILLHGKYTNYPPLFHIILIILNQITGISLNYISIFLPLFMIGILIPLFIFIIVKKKFNFKESILIIPWLIGIPSLIVEMNIHGQMPETMAICLIFSVIYMYYLKRYLVSIFLLIPIFLTHHLSVIPFFIIYIIIVLLENKNTIIKNKNTIFYGLPIFIGVAILNKDLCIYYFNIFKNYSKILIKAIFYLDFENISDIVPWAEIFLAWRPEPLFIYSLLTGVILFIVYYKKNNSSRIKLFIAWFFILFFLSRIPFNNYYSIRLWRQAIYPAIIISSFGLIFILRNTKVYFKIIISSILLTITVISMTTILNVVISPQDYVVLKHEDQEAINYLKNNINNEDKVLANLHYGMWLKVLLNSKIIISNSDNFFIEEADYIYTSGPIAGNNYQNTHLDMEMHPNKENWQEFYKNNRVTIYEYNKLD